MKRYLIFLIALLVAIGIACKSDSNPIGVPLPDPLVQEQNGFDKTGHLAVASCTEAEQILDEIKKFLNKQGNSPAKYEELIRKVSIRANRPDLWQDWLRAMENWGRADMLLKQGKCQEALELAEPLLPEFQRIIHETQIEGWRTDAEAYIEDSERIKTEIEDLYQEHGSEYSTIEEWLKSFEGQPNLINWWTCAISNLEAAKNCYYQGKYNEARRAAYDAQHDLMQVRAYLNHYFSD